MWWLCAVSVLLLTRAPPAAGAPCDDHLSDIQQDLPDEDVYTCTEDYIPLLRQVLPSISSVYEQENSSHVCMNTAIVYTAAIPNSGAHRQTWAKYGEYIFCPPQQWVHSLKHGGVAFLYHPCIQPKLKAALSLLARRYMARHIITPLRTLSRDRPLALAAWCSTLEMSHINRTKVIGWLRDNVHIEQQYKTEEGSYQHLLIRPSVVTPGDSSMHLRVLNYFANKRSQLRRRAVKKRWRRLVLPLTPVVQETTDYNVSHRTTSSAPAGPQTGELANNQTSISSTSGTAIIHSLPDPVTGVGPPVYLPPKTPADGSKADIHSRELNGNFQAERADLAASNEVPTGNINPGLSGLNLGHSTGENASQEVSHLSAGTQHMDSHESKPSKVSVDTVLLITPTSQTRGGSIDQQVLPSEKPLIDSKGQKLECKCQRDTPLQLTAKAQRRLGGSQQKNSEVFVSTPRTAEAKWAAASLIFLFALLALSVLYTQIYKKFRKSQSLYWTSGSHSEEKESVASIIKRRLVQGHSIRKKWIGRKKSPVVLYESLSDSSD